MLDKHSRIVLADDLDLAPALRIVKHVQMVYTEPFLKAIQSGRVLLAQSHRETVGVCWFDVKDGAATIKILSVRAAMRGRGYGRALVDTTFERCRSRTLTLLCPADLPANGFYRRIGFVQIATQHARTGRVLNLYQRHDA